MAEQDIKKSIEKLVDEIIKTEASDATVQKSDFPVGDGEISSGSPTSVSANGGKDKIKSESPDSKEQKPEEAKKAESCDDDKDEDDKKKKDKMKKSDEVAKAEDKKDDKKDDDKDEDKDDKKKKPAFMKKSVEELSAHLDEEELELIKAWREEATKEEEVVAKSVPAQTQEQKGEELTKSLTKVVESAIEPLKKALAEKDEMIKGMNEKIQKMASQPAYDRRSISNLETLEKSGAQTQEISKSQIVEKLLELQLAGKGVSSHHIAEFEATRNISDPHVKAMVFKELKIN